MSAPNTNIETQERRHAGPLGGMKVGLAFAGALLVALIIWTVANGNEPREASEGTTATGQIVAED